MCFNLTCNLLSRNLRSSTFKSKKSLSYRRITRFHCSALNVFWLSVSGVSNTTTTTTTRIACCRHIIKIKFAHETSEKSGNFSVEVHRQCAGPLTSQTAGRNNNKTTTIDKTMWNQIICLLLPSRKEILADHTQLAGTVVWLGIALICSAHFRSLCG